MSHNITWLSLGEQNKDYGVEGIGCAAMMRLMC